jgi:hypothetical protein
MEANVRYRVHKSSLIPYARRIQSTPSCVSCYRPVNGRKPVTVAERPKACTVFARLEAGIVGSNPTEGMGVWYVYVFIPS